MRQSPGEHYEPCGRQLDGLLADQDRANDFRREIKRDARAPELESTDIEGTDPTRRCMVGRGALRNNAEKDRKTKPDDGTVLTILVGGLTT